MSAIMVRAELTPEQWKDLRKLAIDRGEPVQEMIGRVLAFYLSENGYDSGKPIEATS